MSPESVEGYNRVSSENNLGKERYHDIERGDVDPMQLQLNQTQTQQPVQQQATQFDPVTFVKGMISTGYTPTPSQISAANTNLVSDDKDSSDHWIAFLIQRLIGQARAKRQKKR